MNQKDPRTCFEEWLTAYRDHLHMVRQGTCIDLTQPTAAKPPMGVAGDKSKDSPTAQRKPSA